MPETTNDKKVFSLREVTASIRNTLSARYTSSFWVKAEMNKLNLYPHSGHCYPDLVEKQGGRIVAQLKSTLWRDDYLRINRNFMDVVKSPLGDGITMLFCARVTFDAVHGLALRILDIDPVFSLGELEREKQASIARLREEEIFDHNKTLTFPLLPKRLAIISVQTSKGYADFLEMIDGNVWGYRFFHMLFPSLLQGDRAVESIRGQLQRIRRVASHFDVVAIIRGGGGEVGLTCFNDYRLARDIALFPIPVMTGIGHATNETVVEMVAHRNAITPTALGDFLLQRFHDFSRPVSEAEAIIAGSAQRILSEHRQALQQSVRYFRSVTDNVLVRSRHEIQSHARELARQARGQLQVQKQAHTALAYTLRGMSLAFCSGRKRDLDQHMQMLRKDVSAFVKSADADVSTLAKVVASLHPDNVLRRGYSIARINGKAVKSIGDVKAGDQIQTTLVDGVIVSDVVATTKSKES